MRVSASLDLAHQQLGLDGVGHPARAPSARCSAADGGRDARRGAPTSTPTCDERRRRPPRRRRRRGRRASRRARPRGRTASRRSSCGPRRRVARPARPGRRRASASTARRRRWRGGGAGGAWARRRGRAAGRGGPHGGGGRVVELVGEPGGERAEGERRSRWPTTAWLACRPKYRPSSRCIAIGNQSRMIRAKPSAGSTNRADVGDGPQRVQVRLRHAVADVGLGGAGVDARPGRCG